MSPLPPTDLTEWSLHCFCLLARSNPKRVIRLDDNGRLLFQARDGATRDTLREGGIEVTESQLTLLEEYRLITRVGDIITTAFPLLGPGEIDHVRDAARVIAASSLPSVIRRAAEILTMLLDRDLAKSAHAVTFGHALDGVIWEVMRARGGVPDVTLTVEEPFWSGSFWAVYPGREGSAGTNEITAGEANLVMVWDDESAPVLDGIAADPGTVTWLETLEATGGAVPFPFSTGPSDIPVIGAGDPLHTTCVALAEAVVDAIPDEGGCRTLLADAGVPASSEDATVIVTHEVIWEVAARLGESGVIVAPGDDSPRSRLFVRMAG